MKSVIILALVAATWAHWPYAELEHKFRMSSIAVAGNGHDVDTEYAWIFTPLNNQKQPTFQLRFPRKLVTYTLQLSHVAEVKPSGGVFQLVPMSAITFNDVEWFPTSGKWYYDEETFGEVVELELRPDAEAQEEFGWNMAIRLSIFPDSQDDLVDIRVMFDNYHFLGDPTLEEFKDIETQYAIFFKLVSSTGEEAELRNLPLSVDWDLIKFEVDSSVLIDDPEKEHPLRNATQSSAKKSKVKRTSFDRATTEKVRSMMRTRVADLPQPEHETTAQLWFTGGYIATVVGLLPGDYTGGSIWTVVTLSLRTPHTSFI